MSSKLRWCAGMEGVEPVQAGARHLGQVKSSRITLVYCLCGDIWSERLRLWED